MTIEGKFGKQVRDRNIKILKEPYEQFISSKNMQEFVDNFLSLSEIFQKNYTKIRNQMEEREFASLVGSRLEEFVFQIANKLNEKYKKNLDITSIQGKNCPMIIFEKNGKWIGQGCDLAIGKFVFRKDLDMNFMIPKILIESKRYVDVTRLRDVGFQANRWKAKYPDLKFFVFSEHNDMELENYELMRECWGNDVDDFFFIKEGSRNMERRNKHNYNKEEVNRFIEKIDELISNL